MKIKLQLQEYIFDLLTFTIKLSNKEIKLKIYCFKLRKNFEIIFNIKKDIQQAKILFEYTYCFFR